MAVVGHQNGFGVPYGQQASAPPPPPARLNVAVLWRAAIIIIIPILAWALTDAIHDRIPQSAGGLSYDVVVNKFTGDACIQVKNEPTPKGLVDLACD